MLLVVVVEIGEVGVIAELGSAQGSDAIKIGCGVAVLFEDPPSVSDKVEDAFRERRRERPLSGMLLLPGLHQIERCCGAVAAQYSTAKNVDRLLRKTNRYIGARQDAMSKLFVNRDTGHLQELTKGGRQPLVMTDLRTRHQTERPDIQFSIFEPVDSYF